MAGMKYITTLLAAAMLFPSAAVVDMFAEHEAQRDAIRCREEVVEAVEEAPIAPPSVGIGREVVPVYANVTSDELEMLVVLCYLEGKYKPGFIFLA